MGESKPFWKSKAIWGAIIIVLTIIAERYAGPLPEGDNPNALHQLASVLKDFGLELGLGMGIWGLRTQKTQVEHRL